MGQVVYHWKSYEGPEAVAKVIEREALRVPNNNFKLDRVPGPNLSACPFGFHSGHRAAVVAVAAIVALLVYLPRKEVVA
jgi:hypothetical protein